MPYMFLGRGGKRMTENKENKESKKNEWNFVKTIGKTTYYVKGYFSQTSKENVLDKIKRMIINDIQSGGY